VRQVVYRVASSLDGYIAGPRGEIDWIVHDPAVSLASIYAGVDTVLLGRRSYELTQQPGAPPWPRGWRIYVCSRTLRAVAPPATLLNTELAATVATLRSEHGGDIWLFGGGDLFASLLAIGAVDRLEVAVIPVLLGGGTPLLGPGAALARLRLTHSEASASGIVQLKYDIERAAA
jgi:dihydrofolate reductase